MKSLSRSFNGMDLVRSTNSNNSANTNFLSSLIESKDLEIKRLTHIVLKH